ncbi:MAG TPA: coniferyl aldehyde dehydrogenase [Vicinamibacterales bacterium]|jgi:acyl-CoA reductase-like NAD-dependent aldehyde dehydrogenase
MEAMTAREIGTAGSAAGLDAAFRAQREACSREPMPDARTRREWLQRLADLLRRNERAICDAIDSDFGRRPAPETRILELFPSLSSVRYARAHVRRWMRPERRHVSIWFQPGRAELRYQPLGVVGIIVPWNYPLFLAVGPLAASLAAGNRSMIKMSEYGPALGALLAGLMADVFPADLVTVVLGNVQVARDFAALPFDHLLFTGSTAVGRDVMAAAAKNLTPVTLELGGKSPAIVAPGYNLATAAQRIVFGKLVNAGQTCIAPDYVLLPKGEEDAFLAAVRSCAKQFYGTAASPDYASIAHDRQHTRLLAVLADAEAKGARIEPILEPGAPGPRRLPPVALFNCTGDMRVMQEEIFGPLLPIVPYDSLEHAVQYVTGRDRPLSLYVFDGDRGRVDRLLDATHSGGVTVNDCLLHIGQDDLPFGGVGPSGMGRYHGPEGFRTFSHARSVFRQSRVNGLPALYPPYGRRLGEWLLKLMLR